MIHQEFNSVGGGHNQVAIYKNEGFPIPHMHHGTELTYVKSGRVQLKIDGNAYDVDPGAAALILPDRVHSFELSSGGECYVHVFSTDCAPGFFHILGTRTIKTPVTVPASETAEYWIASFLYPCLPEQAYLWHDGNIRVWGVAAEDEASSLRMRSALYAVLSEFLRLELCKRAGAHKNLYGEVFAYLIEHCREELSLEEVAYHFGYEKHYFSRLLKRVSVLSFRQLVNRCRIDIALELLEKTNASVSEIAVNCGYDSQRTFNRVFKQLHGCTPIEYRKQIGGKKGI